MSYNTLENFYKTMFAFKQHHKYSITEVENLMPFERDLFVDMLVMFLKEQENLTSEV